MIRIAQARPRDPSPNMTPMIDVVFQLIIFFLLSSYFIQVEGIGIKLPEADSPSVEAPPELVVVVDGQGRVWVKERPVELAELGPLVASMLSGDDRTVVIKADKTVVLDRVVRVMAACRKAGASKLVIATEGPAAEGL